MNQREPKPCGSPSASSGSPTLLSKPGLGREAPFPDESHPPGFGDGYAEGGEAVQDGDADVELGDLSVEVPGHEPLTEQLHAMHLRLGAAAAMVAAPS